MLKYGFLQRGTITTFHQENKNFSHIKEKKEGTENFWYFESGVIQDSCFWDPEEKRESEIKFVVTSQNSKFVNTL